MVRSPLRFTASPLMLAVALGLLGPTALLEDEDEGVVDATPHEPEPEAEPTREA